MPLLWEARMKLTAKLAPYANGPALMLVDESGRNRVTFHPIGGTQALEKEQLEHLVEKVVLAINLKGLEADLPPALM
jgi:hypothetical protein